MVSQVQPFSCSQVPADMVLTDLSSISFPNVSHVFPRGMWPSSSVHPCLLLPSFSISLFLLEKDVFISE